MPQVVIENPILNSPFGEPARHFRFSDDGITDEIVESRRVSSYFMPVPAAKKRGKQLAFDTEWTRDRVEEDKFIKRVRARVGQWRTGSHVGGQAKPYQIRQFLRLVERYNLTLEEES